MRDAAGSGASGVRDSGAGGAGDGATSDVSDGEASGTADGGMSGARDSGASDMTDSGPAAELIALDGMLIDRQPLRSLAKGISLYLLTYMAQGLKVKGYLAVPESEGKLPAAIFCRGGIRKVGMVRKRRIFSMARRGYVVFAPFYRGNEGGEGREDFAGEDRLDVCHAIAMVRNLPEAAPGPVALIGFSRGAMMALLAARECPDAGPVVVWGGVSSLFDTYEERVDLRRMLKRVVGHPKKQLEAYEDRSPVYWADRIHVPVMIVHGTADEQVSVDQARKLGLALEAAGKDYAMELYDGLGHRFPKEDDERALDAVFAWITRKRAEMTGKGEGQRQRG